MKPGPGIGGERRKRGKNKGEREGGREGEEEGERETERMCVLVLNSIDTLICSQGQKVWMENRSLPLGFFHFSPTGTKFHKMNS